MNTQNNSNTIEKTIQKALPYFFILVLATTIIGVLPGYFGHNSWKMGDWLINYQGGFVRRGFIGELVYMLAVFTNINPGLYISMFQMFFYLVFLLFAYKSLQKQDNLLPYVLLIFSPLLFTFQINDVQGGYKKEIIFLALMAFLTWTAIVKKKKEFETTFFIILGLYPLVILSHEMLAIYLPYLFIIYFSVVTPTKKNLTITSLLLIPSILSFLAAIVYHGSALQVFEILDSLENTNYIMKDSGAMASLASSSQDGLNMALNVIRGSDTKLLYFIAIILALIAYIPIIKKIKKIFSNKLSLGLLSISLIGTIFLSTVAVDWGRFFYIHYVSMFLLTLLPVASLTKQEQIFFLKTKKYIPLTVFLFIVYTLTWHIPHCCLRQPFAQNIKQINLIAFARPYLQVVAHYFPELNLKKKFS